MTKTAGLEARGAALGVFSHILDRRRPFEDAAEALAPRLAKLDGRDRRYALALVKTALRHLGQIDDLLTHWLDEPLPARAGTVPHILRLAIADLLFLKTEPYAAVNAAVDLAAGDAKARHFRGLVNAVLRRAASAGDALLDCQELGQVLLPLWLTQGWRRAYGEETAEAIIAAHASEAPLDLTLKPGLDIKEWSALLGAQILPTGSLRRARAERVEDLPGFEAGAFWVQDAAAALPARLLKDVRGRTIIDLCAAPGGKTAWLAAAGAKVVAVDRSAERNRRLAQNLARLKLEAEIVAEDALAYKPPALADAVLLDAPCTSTGTIRRHPDLPWIKEPGDVRTLAMLQGELLKAGFAMLKPGGTLVYSVCSLEPEEGPEIIEAFLAQEPGARRDPIHASESDAIAEFLTPEGDLRTLPSQWPEFGGLDGFFAARLTNTRASP